MAELPEDVKRKMAQANQRIDQIYDAVAGTNPDMPRSEFRKAFKELADPRLARRDMESIELQKTIQQQGTIKG